MSQGKVGQDDITPMLEILCRFTKVNWLKAPIDGVKASEIRIILLLYGNPEMPNKSKTVSEISKLLQVTSPTVTQTINQLIQNNCVTRSADPADKRMTYITLTEKGEHIAQKAIAMHKDFLRGMLNHLGTNQSQQFIQLLHQALEYIESYQQK